MRILVSAASRHGSTAEIATELGKALRGTPSRASGSTSSARPGGRRRQVRRCGAGQRRLLRTMVGAGPRWQVTAQAAGTAGTAGLAVLQRARWATRRSRRRSRPTPPSWPRTIGARGHVVFPGALHREVLGVREKLAVGLVHAARR